MSRKLKTTTLWSDLREVISQACNVVFVVVFFYIDVVDVDDVVVVKVQPADG